MNIPLVEDNTQFDVCGRFYRRAILNTLIELKPKYCLEIGTHIYQSSRVFSYYFQKYEPEGKLITIDISTWNLGGPNSSMELSMPGVERLMVYPHHTDIHQRHGGLEVYHKNYDKVLRGKSNAANINIKLIHDEMNRLDIDQFSFAFVDGDHLGSSFLADLLICKWLVRPDGFILVDDIFDNGHEQASIYQNLKQKNNNFYEYDDWEICPGMGLIMNKDLHL